MTTKELRERVLIEKIKEAKEIEMGPPTPRSMRALNHIYAYLEAARADGVDVDALIAQVRGF